jgi:hypothetical protein
MNIEICRTPFAVGKDPGSDSGAAVRGVLAPIGDAVGAAAPAPSNLRGFYSSRPLIQREKQLLEFIEV